MKKRGTITGLVVFAALIVLTVLLISTVSGKSAEEEKQLVREAVRRAALTCFSVEGVYPQDLQYLRDHYGLTWDESRYHVHYDCWAENQFPDISVEGGVEK